jgi:hypothetical protein
MDQSTALARDFEQESYRIDQYIWDAMALRAGESALFCGLSNNTEWIKRAVAIGVDVTVIANETEGNEFTGLAVNVVRGSTSMLPARDGSFDATIAFHYLHEIDPFFHANVVSELGRVGKRCVIVEPAPPSDALGLRIASLYSRAKRELGQFENYHHIDYWRKLLMIVKSDVTYQTFSFRRTPPRWAIQDTVAMIIAMMAAEETPEPYLAELRALARRPDAQLLPQDRFVLVGTAIGVHVNAGAGTAYRDHLPAGMHLEPRTAPATSVRGESPPSQRTAGGLADTRRVYSAANAQPELPPVDPPRPTPGLKPVPPSRVVLPASQVARNAFGLPAREDAPARPGVVPSVKGDEATPAFELPDEGADAAAEFGWEWETPPKP